jgi:precorrin-2/cobalt-factor-2 C20-methyltransferase
MRLLQRVDVVFAAASSKNRHSQAVVIAGAHIPRTTPVRMLSFPMTHDRQQKQNAWQANAREIVDTLRQGRDAAFVTLGDPMTYSTFGYMVKQIQRTDPDLPLVTVPGITSYQAAAASINTPLVEEEEALLVVSGMKGGDHLRKLAKKPDTVVFLKAYRNVRDIAAALDEAGMKETSVGVAHCSQPNQEIIHDVAQFEQRDPGYWTLIIAKSRNGHSQT